MDDNKKTHIYITYDTKLRDYLRQNGFCDVIYGLHPKTNNMFWIFERNKSFNQALEKWFNR